MTSNKPYIRWYDLHPKISQASKLLFAFPDEIKSLISEAVLIIAEREFRQYEHKYQMRSIGREKVLGLYKSKNRRREYDENPHLHQAMNGLFLLSEDDREHMAEHILKIVHSIQHYLETCQMSQMPTQLEDLVAITEMYLQSGEDSVKDFLKQMRSEFCPDPDQNPAGDKGLTRPNPLLKIIENVTKQDGTGMKISRSDMAL